MNRITSYYAKKSKWKYFNYSLLIVYFKVTIGKLRLQNTTKWAAIFSHHNRQREKNDDYTICLGDKIVHRRLILWYIHALVQELDKHYFYQSLVSYDFKSFSTIPMNLLVSSVNFTRRVAPYTLTRSCVHIDSACKNKIGQIKIYRLNVKGNTYVVTF